MKLAAAGRPAVRSQVARLAVAGLVGLLVYLLSQDCRTTSMRGVSLGSWRSNPPSVFEDAQQQQQSFCSQDNSSQATPDANYIQHPVSLGLGRANITTPISMWVHAPPDIVSDSIRSSGYWEPHETEQILAQLLKFEQETGLKRQEVYFMDIGANVGWFPLNVAAMGYQVVAFEPMLKNQLAIRRTLCAAPALPGQLTLFPLGLSNRTQTCSFYADGGNLGNGYTGCGADDGSSSMEGKTLLGKFDLVVLDDFLAADMATMAGRVGVLKIDVEGYESRVFEGGLKFMREVLPKFVLSEVNGPAMQSSTGSKPEAVFRMFKDMGYEVRLGSFDGEVQDDFETLGHKSGADRGPANLYFVKQNGM